MKKRLDYIDAAKGFGMLLIIWGHVATIPNGISVWASGFKVSLFFVVSGLLTACSFTQQPSKKNLPLRSAVRKLSRSLLVPYFGFSVLAIAAHLIYGLMKHADLPALLFNDVYMTVTLRGVSTLWFLPAMFIGRILFELFGMRRKKRIFHCVFLLLFGGLLYAAQNLMVLTESLPLVQCPLLTVLRGGMALWFFEAGWLVGTLPHNIRKHVLSWYAAVTMFILTVFLTMFNREVNINQYILGSVPVLFFITGITGTLSLVVLLRCVYRFFRIPPLEYIGKNSLIIMATHLPLYFTTFAARLIELFLHEQSLSPMYFVQCLLNVLLVVLMEFILITVRDAVKKRIWTGKRYE